MVCVGLALLLSSCLYPGQYRRHPGLAQGTCDAACAHYLDCKQQPRNESLHRACVAECADVFADDRASLRAYEGLDCPDAVAFIEGPSGREPGQTGPRSSSSPSHSGAPATLTN